jgi:uncharacterized OB-fold protein
MTLLRAQVPGITVPHPSVHSQPYWDACRDGRLLFQRCTTCGATGLRPSTVCGSCRGATLEWEQSAGSGSLYSWTVVWRPPDPSFAVPYAPAIVRLDEGFWLTSAIIGCQPEDLRDGMRLEVEFHPASDAISLPYFCPISPAPMV